MRSGEECAFLGNSFYLQCSKLRRLKFPEILSVVLLDITMVIVAEGTFKEKTRIKIPVSSISIIPQYSRSASNNTMVERKETSKMTAFIFLVDYCPILKN